MYHQYHDYISSCLILIFAKLCGMFIKANWTHGTIINPAHMNNKGDENYHGYLLLDLPYFWELENPSLFPLVKWHVQRITPKN